MITYYLGAGASCKALPLAREIPARLEKLPAILRKKLSFDKYEKFPNSAATKQDILNTFFENVEWLRENSKNSYSVDTFAKQLYLTGNTNDMHRLKSTLATFIMLEEILNVPDHRYNSFWAAVLDRSNQQLVLPDKVRILSWNYDSQLEKTFYPFAQSYTQVEKLLQSYSSTPEAVPTTDTRKFCILRLNGLANLNKIRGRTGFSRQLVMTISEPTQDNLEEILQNFGMFRDSPEEFAPVLNFAWEEDEFALVMKPLIASIAEQTTTLLVLGYSFPFFNQKTDLEILEQMTHLRKVFIQAPERSHSKLIDRFLTIRPDFKNRIEPISDEELFYIPLEFNE